MSKIFIESVIHGNPPVILAVALTGTVLILRRAATARPSFRMMACGAVQAFLGIALAALMTAHILGTIVRRVRLKEQMWVRFEPHVSLAGIPYDFRLYSLVLFGVLGVWAGLHCTKAASRMARGDSGAWRAAALSWTLTAALVTPILPLQPFAAPILAMCAAGGAVALLSQQFTRSRQGTTVMERVGVVI
jgi:hypothetical protein